MELKTFHLARNEIWSKCTLKLSNETFAVKPKKKKKPIQITDHKRPNNFWSAW